MFIGMRSGELTKTEPGDRLPARVSAFLLCVFFSWFVALGVGCALMDVGRALGVIAATPTTTSTTLPPTFSDDVDVAKFSWRGPSGAKAQTTCTLANVRRDGNMVRYAKGARQWPMSSANGTCDSFACLFVSRDGGATFQGGKFDWARPTESARPLNHMVAGGYLDNRFPNEPAILPPVAGETWVYLELKLDGSERTEARAFAW